MGEDVLEVQDRSSENGKLCILIGMQQTCNMESVHPVLVSTDTLTSC